MNRFLRTSLFLFFTAATAVVAQSPRLSDKPEQFATDVQTVLGANNRVATEFSTNWNSGKFAPAQQSLVIQAARTLAGKGYRAPHLGLFIDALNRALALNTPAASVDSLLVTTRKFLVSTDTKTGQRFLETVRNYYGNGLIFSSNVNKVYATGGTALFRFSDQPYTPYANPTDSDKTKPAAPAVSTDDDGWGFDEKNNEKTDDGWGDAPLGTLVTANGVEIAAPTVAAGAILELKNVSLALVTASDSLLVQNATATVGMKEALLLGTAGQVRWGGDSLRPDAKVALTRFRVDLKNPRLTADEATLTEPALLAGPAKGAYEFLSKKRNPRVPWSYPRFVSGEEVKLKNLGSDLEFRGGVALIGPKVFAVAVGRNPASFGVKHGGKTAFRTTGLRFEFGDSLLTSAQAALTAYLSTGDTLTHPAVKLRYDRARKELHTNRVNKGGFKTAPFADSYHAMTINADAMNWALASQRLDFYTIGARNEVPVRLESVDFFDLARYRTLSGSYGFHPLTALAAYFRERGGRQEAVVSDLQPFFKRPEANLREALMEMVQQGFLSYDPATDVIRFSKKGRHWVQSFAGKEDYDTFVILSKFNTATKDSTSNANVSLDLKTNDLLVRGAQRFQVSDSLKISMAPSDGKVRVLKNRDLTFNGEMKLDNYRFAGQNLAFNYDKFFVKLDKIDSVTFVSQKNKGKADAPEIGGDLQYGSGAGTVYLGKAGNKSGKTPNTPRLVVPSGAKIYFDQPDRAAGVYHRKIYFQIPSLDYDSLTSKDIRMEGMFYSDGLFPPFKATLVSMPDNSLGFVHKGASYPVLGGKATLKLTGPIEMDKNGLHANGELQVNGAVLPSKNLRIYPDSIVAVGTGGSFVAGGKANLPAATFKNYEAHWSPKGDSLRLASQTGTFDFYGGTTKLSGSLLLQTAGLFGEGSVVRKDAIAKSDKFKFTKDALQAENALLQLGTNVATGGKTVLLGRNMDLNLNVTTGNAVLQLPKNREFLSDSAGLEFPYAAYRTTITRADWNVAAKTIAMKGDVATSEFISMAPDQLGLRFNAAEALYEMEKMLLTLKGVPFIQSGDAKIIPNRGQVVVKQDAAIQPLTKAKLVLDTLNGYHTLADGNIRIISRKQFEGGAVYQLVRGKGDTTRLKMNNFEFVESTPEVLASAAKGKRASTRTREPGGLMTTAAASISEADKFYLTPRIRYRGDVVMRSPEPKLRFDGAVQLVLKSRPDEAAWIPFNNANSDDVNIRVDDKLRGDNQPLFAGLHFRSASSGLYTTFVSPKENPADPDVLLATGPLNEVSKVGLVVEPEGRTNNTTLEGNRFVLNDEKKVVNLEGKFNLVQPANLVQTAGLARIHPDSAKYQFNLLLAFDFPLPQPVLSAMGDKLVQTNLDEKNNDPAEPDADRLLTKIASVAGGKNADAYRDKAAGGYLSLASVPGLTKSLVLSSVSLRWSDEQGAFYSVGKLGVSNVGGIDINAALDGHLEIRKGQGRAADEVYLYLEASPEVWYFWSLRPDGLGLVSSDNDFNNAVTANAKGKGKGAGSFAPIAEDEKVLFTERFEQTYVPRSKTKPAAKPSAKPAPARPAPPVAKKEAAPATEKPATDVAKGVSAKKAPADSTAAKLATAPKGLVAPDSAAAKRDSTAKKGVAIKPKADEVVDELTPAKKKAEEKKTGF
jgi:hypothetical protein